MNLFSNETVEKRETKFEINYNGRVVSIEKLTLANQSIYRAIFADRAALILTRARNSNAVWFWTSIPEGRQVEAEEIGALIREYINRIF